MPGEISLKDLVKRLYYIITLKGFTELGPVFDIEERILDGAGLKRDMQERLLKYIEENLEHGETIIQLIPMAEERQFTVDMMLPSRQTGWEPHTITIERIPNGIRINNEEFKYDFSIARIDDLDGDLVQSIINDKRVIMSPLQSLKTLSNNQVLILHLSGGAEPRDILYIPVFNYTNIDLLIFLTRLARNREKLREFAEDLGLKEVSVETDVEGRFFAIKAPILEVTFDNRDGRGVTRVVISFERHANTLRDLVNVVKAVLKHDIWNKIFPKNLFVPLTFFNSMYQFFTYQKYHLIDEAEELVGIRVSEYVVTIPIHLAKEVGPAVFALMQQRTLPIVEEKNGEIIINKGLITISPKENLVYIIDTGGTITSQTIAILRNAYQAQGYTVEYFTSQV